MTTSKLAFVALFSAILILGLTVTTNSAQAGSNWSFSVGNGGGFYVGHGHHGHFASVYCSPVQQIWIPGHYVQYGCHYDYIPGHYVTVGGGRYY